jgi:hypothetical protein
MSFKVHNTDNDEARNEIIYSLSLRNNTASTTTVINRGNPTDANPLLLSDLNTIHYYHYTGSKTEFDISTLMLENAVYEVKFNCSGGSDSNNDMLLTPNHGNYSNSNFYTIFLNSFDLDERDSSAKYKTSTDNEGFYVDFFDGFNGYDPVGKITIYNRRNCKKILIEASDTSGSTTASGYWLDNSSESESYMPNSSAPSYNTTDIWSAVGTLYFGPSFTNWTIYVSRIG